MEREGKTFQRTRFLLCSFTLMIGFLALEADAQQGYSGNAVMPCNSTFGTGPASSVLYTCNGKKSSCPAFLLVRAQPPLYDSVPDIANLTSSDPSEVARINNISSSGPLPTGKGLIVPVTCSCSGQYYQANSSYVVQSVDDTYFSIANLTYQGLASCDSLRMENAYGKLDLDTGLKLTIPLRCACPTANQTAEGINFLLTYPIAWEDSIPKISDRFNVSRKSLANANGFSDDEIYPFTTILVPLRNQPTRSSDGEGGGSSKVGWSNKGILVGIGAGTFSAALCSFLYLMFSRCKRGKSGRGGQTGRILPVQVLAEIAAVDQVLKVYGFDELEKATECFGLQNRLSVSVYRGVLQGETVAIKQMNRDVSREVKILKNINHFNLISLYGACENDRDCYLVYEFMDNGSLKEWLRQSTCTEIHSWRRRIGIAFDVTMGLQYLHNFTYTAYMHRDINSDNILLDKHLRAKISNFGLARSEGREITGNSSVKYSFGSKGYLAPEYLEEGLATRKMDVYAFGVVLLELITGREAAFEEDGKAVLLSDAAKSMFSKDSSREELDRFTDRRLQLVHHLGYVIDQSELAFRLVKLSLACLETDPCRRLSMVEVVSTLISIQMDALGSDGSYIY